MEWGGTLQPFYIGHQGAPPHPTLLKQEVEYLGVISIESTT